MQALFRLPSLSTLHRSFWSVAVIAAFYLAATTVDAASSERVQDRALEQVRVQLKWLHQFQFAGYYAALEKGFYSEVGLDVELIEGSPESDPLHLVLSGAADFGSGTPDLLISYADGAPIVVLGVIFQHSPYVFLCIDDSGIDTINDLAGKRIMIEPQSAELYAYLERENIPIHELTILPHTFSPQALMDGSVDVISAYSTDELFTLKSLDIPFKYFSPRSAGIDFYGDCFFTSQALLRERPDLVRAFREATIRGWKYAMDNPEEIIDLILEKYPTNKSRDALLYEARRMRDLIYPDLIPIGYMYPGRWSHILHTYQNLGMIPQHPVDLEAFLYDPEPKPENNAWLIGLLTISTATLIVVLAILLPLWRLNIRLRREIQTRQQAETSLRIAKDQAELASHAKTEFISTVTHDLRTPLNAILGITNLLIEELKDESYRANLRTIQSSGQSLLQLVNNLLDLNQLDSGKIVLRDKPFLIDDALDPVAELLASTARRKGIEFAWWIEPGLPGGLNCDPDRLRQIILNLGGNAVKFTDVGHVALSAGVSPEGHLLITISDTGPGIPAEIQDSIFDPFVRASNTRKKEGTGLGLSIVRRITQTMGGTINLRSTEGIGTTFTLDLPIRDDSATGDIHRNYQQALGQLPISIYLQSPLRTHATSRNLQSLGVKILDTDSVQPNPDALWHLIDEDSSSLHGKTRDRLIFLPRDGQLLTRSFLARTLIKFINRPNH